MKSFVPTAVILLLVFLSGSFTVNTRDSSARAPHQDWRATEIPARALQEGALARLAKNKRWDVELVSSIEAAEKSGDLASQFRLIAVINSDSKYSVLQSKETDGLVLRLAVGDMINSQWKIKEIGNAKIIATHNGLEQALELFPGN